MKGRDRLSELESFLSADARAFRKSAIRAFGRITSDPRVISFAGGLPNPATFPIGRLAELASKVIMEKSLVALQYGVTPGLPRLRETVAQICAQRKIRCSASEVLLTTGSQQALDLVARTLVDPGDVVLVELPSYIGGLSSLYARRAELVGVLQDDGGLIPDELARTCQRLKREQRRIKVLYTIPNFQNPSGRLMIQQRRREILELSRQFDFLIIEDDPYGELVFSDDSDTTPIRAMDDSGRVIYLGSFSKILSPGLRCGFVVATETIFARLELAKEAADLCSGMLDQSIVDEFCAAGELPAQVVRVRDFYRARRDVLMESLHQHFAGRADWTPAQGGLFTFLTLGDARDTREWVARSVEKGVAYIPGAPFFVDGSGANTMRLTFAKEPDERIREGIALLAAVLFGS